MEYGGIAEGWLHPNQMQLFFEEKGVESVIEKLQSRMSELDDEDIQSDIKESAWENFLRSL